MPLLPTIKEEERHLSWSGILYSYRLQFQAMSSASTIFIAGGMKLAWSVFETPFFKAPTSITTHLLTIAWFVGVAAGAIISASFVQHVSKNVAHCVSVVLLLLGGVLFVCTPTLFAALFSSCLLEGCAYGINQIQSLVTAGEIAHKDIRGLLVSSERIFPWFGICLQLFCTRLWFVMEPINGYVMHVNQLHGIVVIVIALAALVFNFLYNFESPLLLMMQQRDLAATYIMKRLQGAHYPSIEVTQKREECKQVLAYDAGHSSKIVMCRCNAFSLLKVLLLRCYGMISVSLPVNRIFITMSMTGLNCTMNCVYLLALCGMFGSILGALCVDNYGRRRITVISLLFAGTCTFLMGGILQYIYDTISSRLLTHLTFEFVVYLMLFYQIFICAGVTLTSSVYMSEAFTIKMKAKCLSLIIVIEQVVQLTLVLIISYTDFNVPYFFLIIGVMGMIFGMLALFLLPETMYLSLYECLWKFNTDP